MELSDLQSRAGEWLKGTGPESDIVISSRIRLARNLVGYSFTSRLEEEKRKEVAELLRFSVAGDGVAGGLTYFDLEAIDEVDRLFLVERHLISKEHAEGHGPRGVAVHPDETVSIMVNEEDHLRIQALRSGFQLGETWHAIDGIDDAIDRKVDYAHSNRLGYLTACPTNVGTGLRASVMLHLPALTLTKQIEKVIRAVTKMNLAVRGLFGEGTQFLGNFYQVSNQATLGKSEEEILDNISSTVPQIIRYERQARTALAEQSRERLEDRVWRAFGTLETARVITSNEAIDLLSQLRLGINLGLVEEVAIGTVNELFVLTLPAHLQKLEGQALEPAERDVVRARFIRQRLTAR